MKTKTLLQSTTLTVFILLLTGFFTCAQIPFEGLAADHEGAAAWNADGTGPDPAGYGHPHPFGWPSSLYYGASRDYDDIDPIPMRLFAIFSTTSTDSRFSSKPYQTMDLHPVRLKSSLAGLTKRMILKGKTGLHSTISIT